MNDSKNAGCLGILSEPLQPGWSRRCAECRAWFALVRQSERTDELQREITTFRCRKCDHVVEFADSHPPGAV